MTFPPDFTRPDKKARVAEIAAKVIATLAPDRRVVVQAGGCAGLWPLALANHFAEVYAFEPEPTNFECLCKNAREHSAGNIWAYDRALGDASRRVGLTRPKAKAGLWRVDGDGDTQMVSLDDFFSAIPVLDALVLDVEGHEVQAWKGAETLIAKFRPLLWFEGIHNTDAINEFLKSHGYGQPIVGMNHDYFSVHETRKAHQEGVYA